MPYKFFTQESLAKELGITVDQLIKRIKTKKIKCIVLKEQIIIRESEYKKHKGV